MVLNFSEVNISGGDPVNLSLKYGPGWVQLVFTSTKEVMFYTACVCLSVRRIRKLLTIKF